MSTTDFRAAVLLILSQRESHISKAAANDIVSALLKHIAAYRRRAAAGENRPDPWMRDRMAQVVERIDDLTSLLQDPSCSPNDPDHVAFCSSFVLRPPVREVFFRTLADLRAAALFYADGHKPVKGRPANENLNVLNVQVADALDRAGVRVANSAKDGASATFVRILTEVHGEIGIDTKNMSTSVNKACQLLPEWREMRHIS